MITSYYGGPPDTLSYEAAQRKAKELGLEIVLPAENELQVDIDSMADFELFRQRVKVLKEVEGEGIRWRATPSKSGGDRMHITVTLPRRVSNNTERVALQSLLGSDAKRELLSLKRIREGYHEHPTLFFEHPGPA